MINIATIHTQIDIIPRVIEDIKRKTRTVDLCNIGLYQLRNINSRLDPNNKEHYSKIVLISEAIEEILQKKESLIHDVNR